MMADMMETVGAPLTSAEMGGLHCTVIYSRKTPVDLPVPSPDTVVTACMDRFQFWPGHDNAGYVVVKLTNSTVFRLHEFYVQHGCEHSFPTYDPHMTVRTRISEADGSQLVLALNQIVASYDDLTFVGPYTYNLKEDWKARE